MTLFDTGYCLSFERIVAANKPWKLTRFYATAALIEHPKLGPILFDTGYSPHVKEACKRFPYFIYKLVTPIHYCKSAAEKLVQYGYKAKDIQHIIISHFHADHIGGLNDFPNATFHYLSQGYEAIKDFTGIQAVRHAYLPSLIPHDFRQRSQTIFQTIPLPYSPFSTGFDIFGDQSVIGIELPGHAKGQLGVLLQTEKEKLFLIADACWQSSQYKHLELPHFLGRTAIDDYDEFCKTLNKLHHFNHKFPDIKIIPSHCFEIWQKECTC